MLLNKDNLKKIIISQDLTIFDVIKNLNTHALKVVLVIDKKKNFLGIINDGDIRRAFLKGYNVDSSIQGIINKKAFCVKDILELSNLSTQDLEAVTYVPVVKNKKILELYIHKTEENVQKKINKEHVVIMAGGFGKRLGPLTKNCPKALLKFNNKPLLQHIIEHIKKNSFNKIYISVFFMKQMIERFIFNNKFFSLNIKFIKERKPMGTIGSIGLIKKISNNFIVLNCDVISKFDLNELLKFHKKNNAVLTIAVKNYQYKNPYGVIISKKNKFISFKEKPEINFTINTGMYVFNKKVIPIIKKFNLKNIEDLITILNNKKFKIFTYPIFEIWNDLGQNKKQLKKYN
ncbi:sugar phosphate nucleotidyltransferase [Pelagibacteraceae bacterium]|nr:sugar phosphate nucleotidyltransferase [Pelagibacteraceae bacterium]